MKINEHINTYIVHSNYTFMVMTNQLNETNQFDFTSIAIYCVIVVNLHDMTHPAKCQHSDRSLFLC